jgi:AcrR family transcriptional regulator
VDFAAGGFWIPAYLLKRQTLQNYGGLIMSERIEDTRDRITQAALGVFSTKGYAGATTREIAETAGVNEVTLFRHFGNKAKLLVAVVENYSAIPVIIDTLKNDLSGDYRQDLKTIAMHILELWEQRKQLIMFMMMESQHHPQEVKMLTHVPRKVREYLSEYLQELSRRGIVKPLNFTASAQAFISGLFAYFLTAKLFGADFHPYSTEDYVDNFVEIFVSGTAVRATR